MDLLGQQPIQGPQQLKNGDSEVGCHTSLRKSTKSRFLSMGSPATATGTTIHEDRNRGKYRQPLNSASTSCCPCQQGGVAGTTPEQTVPWLVPTHRKRHSRGAENCWKAELVKISEVSLEQKDWKITPRQEVSLSCISIQPWYPHNFFLSSNALCTPFSTVQTLPLKKPLLPW